MASSAVTPQNLGRPRPGQVPRIGLDPDGAVPPLSSPAVGGIASGPMTRCQDGGHGLRSSIKPCQRSNEGRIPGSQICTKPPHPITPHERLRGGLIAHRFWCRALAPHLELVYLVTALVPSDTACLASSPGSSRRTAVWISRDVMVERLL
ncbi:hypothetical protein QTO34_010954 [Cnephaeus nilssonii]|uniref:Uncharacterized protein n=1 Tax=Cnephaeus nilssonii TaxID=3371016 RepID=A0AA40LDK5_CNENI|nr:hypothetical protein QTO34_010954 [Eptesicus nilssonii]